MSMLNRHADIWIHGEPFHQNTIIESLKKFFAGETHEIDSPGFSVEQRKEDPFGYLEALMAKTESRYLTGFKIFPGHDDRVAEAMIDDSQVKKIVLVRMNALAQFSSDLEASARNRYAFTPDETPETVEIVFDAEEFERRRKWISSWYARMIERLNTKSQPYFFMPYELLGNELYMRSVFVFLGINPPEMEEIHSQYRKSGARNVVSRFANSEQVKVYLRETGQENLEFDVGYHFL
ncbi:hypothetical protein NHF40_02060 [Maricaulaceae bacterium EIL42A08]|nr:hypothetical protein [Maricaulaceae bacterium EIL42A08]